jgi:hypothetical protein
MRKKYQRASLDVEAEKYETGKGMEDGFALWTKVITNGWVSSEGLVKITNENGQLVCPFIQNRRGMIFIREGDYIIYEDGGERHCCGGDKFAERFREAAE